MTTIAVLLKTGNPIHVLFYTVPFICDPLSCKPIAYTKEQYRYPPNLDLADFQGQSWITDRYLDWFRLLLVAETGKVIQRESGLTAIETHLGWVFSGPLSSTTEQNRLARPSTSHAMHISTTHLSNLLPHLNNLLKVIWDLKSLAIKQGHMYLAD